MLELSYTGLADPSGWERAGVRLPAYDLKTMAEKTEKTPIWVHFGAGNLFRGFIAALQQRLLDQGLAESGILAAETFDYDIISQVYAPHDSMTLMVSLRPDGSTGKEVLSSIAKGVKANPADGPQWQQLVSAFENPSLQLASFTITEKGYALYTPSGELLPAAAKDMHSSPDKACHAMGIAAALLLKRFQAGAVPLAVVSLDNCSHNGEKLRASILSIAHAWQENGIVGRDFIDYLEDETRVAFPWSMIDKITPRPAEAIEKQLTELGIGGMKPVLTSKGTYIAPFVNAEAPQYLVVEDTFPNGRPPLEQAGVYFGDRATVNRSETMKVTTCLNPLHTAMSVYGCLLGYTLIWKEMKDADIVALIRRLGYQEGLPVVTDPKILSPKAFLDEVIEQRFPNPFLPDAPQRIATDTSQKVGIRFGETIKSYLREGRDLNNLVSIPLALAGWLRYLLAVDDNLSPMEVSSDPLREELQGRLSGIRAGDPSSYHGELRGILSNASIFGVDLAAAGLAGKIEQMFVEELAGPGAVRATLRKYLS